MKPLSGVTVIDISRLLPGGYTSLLLSELGARVIKVEQPGVGDYYRAMQYERASGFASARESGPGGSGAIRAAVPPLLSDQVDVINQGKEGLGLDLKTPEGREIFLKLVRRADVVIENFRPGTLKRLKIGYPTLRRIRRSIVLCSITGFGQKGPRSHLAGHDLSYLGLSGLLDRLRDPEGRYLIPDFQLVDLTAGYDAAMRIVAALASPVQGRRSRKGCWIDVSMVGAGRSLSRLYALEEGSSPVGGRLIRYGIYETSDGRWVTLAALEPKFWTSFCEVIGHPEWSRGAERFEFLGEERQATLRETFRSKTTREWVDLGAKKDLCLFPVERVKDLGLVPKKKAPRLGEHTGKILRSIGYRSHEIQSLRLKGVVE